MSSMMVEALDFDLISGIRNDTSCLGLKKQRNSSNVLALFPRNKCTPNQKLPVIKLDLSKLVKN